MGAVKALLHEMYVPGKASRRFLYVWSGGAGLNLAVQYQRAIKHPFLELTLVISSPYNEKVSFQNGDPRDPWSSSYNGAYLCASNSWFD
jgi:hypothetical protein